MAPLSLLRESGVDGERLPPPRSVHRYVSIAAVSNQACPARFGCFTKFLFGTQRQSAWVSTVYLEG